MELSNKILKKKYKKIKKSRCPPPPPSPRDVELAAGLYCNWQPVFCCPSAMGYIMINRVRAFRPALQYGR